MTRRAFGAAAMGSAMDATLHAGRGFVKPQFPEITQSRGVDLPVTVERNAIAYLMADDATRSATLKVFRDKGRAVIKRFWVEDWRTAEQEFAWTLRVTSAGEYEVTAIVSAAPGSVIRIAGPENVAEITTTQPQTDGYAWDRITAPAALKLRAGANKVRVRLTKFKAIESHGAALKSLELLHVAARPAIDERIRQFRSDTGWLNEAKFGFMCQCGEWSYPPHGSRKPWPERVNDFPVEKFADMVQSTSAGYVIWSATWATYYFPAPIKAIDSIVAGRTSKRDLIGELAQALGKRGIRLMLYYHVGHDPRPENGRWWDHNWVNQYDKQLFFNNWCAIVTEVGERYGDHLAGWLFDDELVYYPAPYERLGRAAKAGSAERIIAYNAWIQARGTDFQDLQFGEGNQGSAALPVSANGIWPSGPQKGLHAHGNFQLDGPDWGIARAETVISPPRISEEAARVLALAAAERNEALSWNLLMYSDGSVSDASLKVLQAAGKSVREKYPRFKKPFG